MSSKHTPGPWIYAYSDSDTCHFVVSAPHEREEVAGEYGIPRSDDARLIAAAPELLDALIEAVDCGMVPISSAKDGGASTHSRQVRCADMIRAAIAKATGETQCAS
nr:hypothetical protein [Stenotrophomonas geniculata]